MPLPTKRYWPTAARVVHHLCAFILKHRDTLRSVVAQAVPDQATAIETAFNGIAAACSVFEIVATTLDPNWKP